MEAPERSIFESTSEHAAGWHSAFPDLVKPVPNAQELDDVCHARLLTNDPTVVLLPRPYLISVQDIDDRCPDQIFMEQAIMTQADKTAAAVSGRATGVLFFAGFGAIWMRNGLAAMHRLNSISLAAIAVIAASLIIPAVRLLVVAARNASQAGADSPEQLQMRQLFWRVNTIQWAAIVAAVILLNLIHKGNFLVPVITFIVGMHLFPLAKVFRYPAHNVTGTLLTAWATVLAATLPESMLPSVGAVGTAAILLGSAAYTLTAATRAAKAIAATGTLRPFAA
jgi:hypothetical protein